MNIAVYKHILHTYGRRPGIWIGLVAEAFRLSVMRVYIVIAMAQVTTSLASGDLSSAKKYTFYFLIADVVGAIIGSVGELISIKTENREYGRLMVAFYKKLIGKDIAFYRDHQTGYLASMYRQYLDSLLQLIRLLRGEVLNTLIALVVPPLVLFIASPLIGMVAIGIIVVQFLYVTWSSRQTKKYRDVSHEVYRKITGEVSDIITNIVAFKAGGTEEQSNTRLAALSKEETTAFDVRRSRAVLYGFWRSIITIVGITSAIFVVIMNASTSNPASLGLMVLTLTYMFQIYRNVNSLPDLVVQHDDQISKAFPTLRYLSDEYEFVRDPKNPKPLRVTIGAIDIEKVSFSYPSHSKKGSRIPVFQNLSIRITGGEHVGIVGLSGAGKSTLAYLLLRFDEIESGSIRVDGTDIREVKQSDLRKHIAYVPQEPLLFHRTIKENISYYNTKYSQSEIEEAARAAHAHEFIEKLPDKYETVVGERGIKLSGGQKQRIAIARAILKKAPILIFDEATSALDSESEQIIQRALPEIIGTQTAVVVAHRLSTVAGLHRIIVMHEGEIVESGTHDELLAQKGRYYSLWQKQTREFATLSDTKARH